MVSRPTKRTVYITSESADMDPETGFFSCGAVVRG